jgi:type I site-specific restriction endonuclease
MSMKCEFIGIRANVSMSPTHIKTRGLCEDSADNKQGGVLAPQPEQQARGNIDVLLQAAGWHVCDAAAANIHAARGVAIREFPLPGYGFADYLLYVDGKAAGVIEAKKEGVTLTRIETQSDKNTKGLPAGLPRWGNSLPFVDASTGVETRFTCDVVAPCSVYQGNRI